MTDNLPLARYYARRLGRSGPDRDDVFQEGALALAQAAERYDLDHAPLEHFGRYAGSFVRGAVYRWLEKRRRERSLETAPPEGFDAAEREAPRLDPGDAKAALDYALGFLSQRQLALVRDRFGLDGREALSWTALAAKHRLGPRSARTNVGEAKITLAFVLLANGWEEALGGIAWLLPLPAWPEETSAA